MKKIKCPCGKSRRNNPPSERTGVYKEFDDAISDTFVDEFGIICDECNGYGRGGSLPHGIEGSSTKSQFEKGLPARLQIQTTYDIAVAAVTMLVAHMKVRGHDNATQRLVDRSEKHLKIGKYLPK